MALTTEGEALTEEELSQCLQLLKGKSNVAEAIPEQLRAVEFHEDILGFEEVEEEEEDEYGNEVGE